MRSVAGLTLALALALALASAPACGGGKTPAAAPGPPQTGERSAEAAPQDGAKAKPKRLAATADWVRHGDDTMGFEVLGPPGAPKVMNDLDHKLGLRAAAKTFLFPENLGMGQVMVLEYIGDKPYDLEAGLDGGCKQAVARIDGTMTIYTKRRDADRPARQFQFGAKTRGKEILGVGRAIGTGPKTIKVALAMWAAERPKGQEMAGAFVSGFVAK